MSTEDLTTSATQPAIGDARPIRLGILGDRSWAGVSQPAADAWIRIVHRSIPQPTVTQV